MQWGTDTEPHARAFYVQRHGADVSECGFVDHPEIAMTGASPDGLVGSVGMLEIKCPNTATHLETLLNGAVAGKYVTQMQWQMACAGREWCDFASFDPRLPPSMQLFVKRVERDVSMILDLETEVAGFLREIDQAVARLRELYETAEAA
jgi:predicted phage-related endonuclease